jgi:hypothetical protein
MISFDTGKNVLIKQTGVADKKNMPIFAMLYISKAEKSAKHCGLFLCPQPKKYTVSCPRVVG